MIVPIKSLPMELNQTMSKSEICPPTNPLLAGYPDKVAFTKSSKNAVLKNCVKNTPVVIQESKPVSVANPTLIIIAMTMTLKT